MAKLGLHEVNKVETALFSHAAADNSVNFNHDDFLGCIVVLVNDLIEPRAGRARVSGAFAMKQVSSKVPDVVEHADAQEDEEDKGHNHPSSAFSLAPAGCGRRGHSRWRRQRRRGWRIRNQRWHILFHSSRKLAHEDETGKRFTGPAVDPGLRSNGAEIVTCQCLTFRNDVAARFSI